MDIIPIIVLLVYLALALGTLPGFKVDRTGATVVGALALLVTGSISSQDAWAAIDYRTLGMLFGLMLVSGAFAVSGFYAVVAGRVAHLEVTPPLLLAAIVAVGGVLSALLTNSVVAVAMTPLLVSASLARGLNPVPFLLGFCFATNIGATATIIGSPKNMILAQALDLSFTNYFLLTVVPVVLGLALCWAILAWLYRGRWTLDPAGAAATAAPTVAAPAFDRTETVKAGAVTAAVILAFVATDWPHELIALAAGGFLLVNRRIASGDVMQHVDGNLLLLIMGLFVVNAALASTGLPQQLIRDAGEVGLRLTDPVPLFLIGAVVSDIITGTPAAMLLAPFLTGADDPHLLGAALALGLGFSSNIFIFSSLAGIIVVEQAARHGVRIGFGEFFRAGAPVTVISMLIAVVWLVAVLS